MSNIEAYRQAKDVVLLCEADFVSLSDQQTWAKESRYALQVLKESKYLTGIAMGDLDSLKQAIVNVASFGLTLNPIKKHAYLVPRKKKIYLDVSYLGFIQMAVDSGIFSFIKAEVVYEKDNFVWNGIGREPIHEADYFADRGAIVGAYCLAKLNNGDFVIELMPINEIYAIRDRSESWKSGGFSPWKSDALEMIKKTVVRRAAKASWPIPTDLKTKIEQAGYEEDLIEADEVTVSVDPGKSPLIDQVDELLFILDKTREETIVFCGKLYQRKIESLEALTLYELQKLAAMLEQRVAKIEKEIVVQKRKDYEDQRNNREESGEVPIELELESDGDT